ncbi:hypothetical protein EC81_023540 [Bacteroides fragilis]|nr:hypothetical protein EC81_023540 [Bacteroides fragilis]
MVRLWDCVKTLFTTDYTDYHRIRMLIINNLKITLCYSVSSVVSFDTPSFVFRFLFPFGIYGLPSLD